MILSDKAIQFHSAFLITSEASPFRVEQLQPASYDVTLGAHFQVPREKDSGGYSVPVDPADPASYGSEWYDNWNGSYDIRPGQFILAHTVEAFRLPPDIQAQVCGKSSLGRLGLFVENAGFVDPGFRGQLTLELFNCSPRVIRLQPGMRIAQVSFQQLDQPAACPYGCAELGSHYQGQQGATISRGSF